MENEEKKKQKNKAKKKKNLACARFCIRNEPHGALHLNGENWAGFSLLFVQLICVLAINATKKKKPNRHKMKGF